MTTNPRGVTNASDVRTHGQAMRVFFSKRTPRTIAKIAAGAWAARLVLGPPTLRDVAAAVTAIAIWPLQEWALHKHLLAHRAARDRGHRHRSRVRACPPQSSRRSARYRHDPASDQDGSSSGSTRGRALAARIRPDPRRGHRHGDLLDDDPVLRVDPFHRPHERQTQDRVRRARATQSSPSSLSPRGLLVRLHASADRPSVRHRSRPENDHAIAHRDGPPRSAHCRRSRQINSGQIWSCFARASAPTELDELRGEAAVCRGWR